MRFIAILILGLLICPARVQAEPALAGVVKTLEGTGVVARGNATISAKIGMPLYVNDVVYTSNKSSIGIMLEDDTILSLGANSRLELKDFLFEPKNELFSIAVRLLKGSFAYMSGVIGRLAPEKVRIETPDAVIAVHGTRFLVTVEGK